MTQKLVTLQFLVVTMASNAGSEIAVARHKENEALCKLGKELGKKDIFQTVFPF